MKITVSHILSLRALCRTLAASVLLATLAPVRAEFRTWTSAQGKRVEAEFVALKDGKVEMKLRSGKPASVALDQLSRADQEYVSKKTAPAPAPSPSSTPAPAMKPATAQAQPPPLPGDTGPAIPALPPLLPLTPEMLWERDQSPLPAQLQLDAEGKLRFGTALFNQLRPFSENLAWAAVKNPVAGLRDIAGFIDPSGKFVLGGDSGVAMPGDGNWRGDFHDGLCAFRAGDGAAPPCGYMDRTGKVVIEPAFKFALPFSGGLAAVSDRYVLPNFRRLGTWRYIDREGKTVLPGPWLEAHPFDEGGLARVDSGKDDRKDVLAYEQIKQYQFISKEGQPIAAGHCLRARSFAGKTAHVYVRKEDGTEADRIIDRTGKVVFESSSGWHDAQWSADSGVMIVSWYPPGGEGVRVSRLVLQETGVPYGPPLEKYSYGPFYEGLASFRTDGASPLHGCIDRTGKVVIAPRFPHPLQFINGLASTREGTDTVLINTTGKVVYRLPKD